MIHILAGILAAASRPLQTNFVGGTFSATDTGANAVNGYQVASDGFEKEDDNGVLTPFNEWLVSGNASDVEVRMTMVSGTSFSGASLNTWLNCGTSRLWTLTDTSTLGGPVTGTGTLEFGNAGANTALGSVSVSISSELTA